MRAFIAWRLHARHDAELRQRLRAVVYRMLMGRLAGAFAGWRSITSQLAHERRLLHTAVTRLRFRVRITAALISTAGPAHADAKGRVQAHHDMTPT